MANINLAEITEEELLKLKREAEEKKRKKERKKEEVEVDYEQLKLDVIKKINPFKDFYRLHNKSTGSIIIYYRKDNTSIPVSDIASFDKKTVVTFLYAHDKTLLGDLEDSLVSLINPKDSTKVSIYDVIECCLNVCSPLRFMDEKISKGEPHPAVIQGLNIPALHYIAYTPQESNLGLLNPLLREFLLRVSNYENMCANIWTNFIGIKTPALIYLKGSGGDGKSIFVKMLAALAGSYCNYDWSERFNYFNMFGKSIIIMNENKMPNVLQHSVLKAITGGDYTQIEGKGKNAFSAEVRGQLIMASNDQINVMGTPDEARRLRYYTVETPNISEEDILNPDEYLLQINSTPNEFLNYCRICYDKFKTSGGIVKVPVDHVETLKSLRDPEVQIFFDKVMYELLLQYEVSEGSEIDASEIIPKVLSSKNKYALQNFEALAKLDYNIVRKGNKYLNLKRRII